MRSISASCSRLQLKPRRDHGRCNLDHSCHARSSAISPVIHGAVREIGEKRGARILTPMLNGFQRPSSKDASSSPHPPAGLVEEGPFLDHARAGERDRWISARASREQRGQRRGDRFLATNQEPPLGTHLVTPRRGYTHHGIYVGGGRVVHYGSLVHYLHRRPVEEVSLARFTRGHPVWVRSTESPRFDCAEAIRRARSRVGEDRYRLFSNNCEHFCEWCLHGEHRSYQVEELRARLRRIHRFVSAPLRAPRIPRVTRPMTLAVMIALALAQGASPVTLAASEARTKPRMESLAYQ